MKKLGIIGGLILSTTLLISGMSAALAGNSEATPTMTANSQGEQQYQGIFGFVDIIEGDTITLETKSLGMLDVLLTEGTIYKVPGQEEASKDDIEVESRLAILAIQEESIYSAVRVMVVPGEATQRHVNGVIVSIEDRVLTIINIDGDTLTVELPEGVQGGVIGDFISVAVRNSLGEGPYVASGLQTAAEVQARIQTHLNEVAGRRAETQAEIQQRGQDIEELSELLEGLAQRHRDVLQGILDEAPEEAKESIQAAIMNAEQGLEKARQSINEAKAGTGGQHST